MLVRTIAQLPQVSSDYSNGLLEISVPDQNLPSSHKYTSKSICQTTLSSGIASAAEGILIEKYGLIEDGSPIKLDILKREVDGLSSNDVALDGVKDFKQWPTISKPLDEFPTPTDQRYPDQSLIVPNIAKVNDLIGSQPVYFSSSTSMVAEGVPLNAHSSASTDKSVPESLEYTTTVGSGKFYFWRIDGRDSSQSIYDTRSATVDPYEQMRDTGQLVVWGWLADNGEVSPEMAWVGLFAAIKCEGADATQTYDLPISIQPWIRGEHASQLQYISFNVPVKKGLKVKIKTGFPVNQQTSGGYQNKGTLTFIDRYVPNAFFGYIIKGGV